MGSNFLYLITIFLFFVSHNGRISAEENQPNAFDIFTGEATVFENDSKENTETIEKRSSVIPRPTLQIEETDKGWCKSKKLLTLTYNNSVEVKCGKDYQLNNIRYLFHDPPQVSAKNVDANKLYTLVMLDPDAPDRKNHLARNWLHWLVVDIANGTLSTGKEIVDYEPPEPPPGTGKHRYVFLYLQQEGPSANRYTAGRTAFSIRRYAREHNIVSAVSAFSYFTGEEKLK